MKPDMSFVYHFLFLWLLLAATSGLTPQTLINLSLSVCVSRSQISQTEQKSAKKNSPVWLSQHLSRAKYSSLASTLSLFFYRLDTRTWRVMVTCFQASRLLFGSIWLDVW